jgi:hypothetical protein
LSTLKMVLSTLILCTRQKTLMPAQAGSHDSSHYPA